MNEVTLNYDNKKGTLSRIQLDSTPLILKMVDEHNNVLHLFELVESGQYFEISENDSNENSTQTQWKNYKTKFNK